MKTGTTHNMQASDRSKTQALIPTCLFTPLLDWLQKSVHKLFSPSLHPLLTHSSNRVRTVRSDITVTLQSICKTWGKKLKEKMTCLQVIFFWYCDFCRASATNYISSVADDKIWGLSTNKTCPLNKLVLLQIPKTLNSVLFVLSQCGVCF